MAINPGFITLENNTITITEVNTTLDGGNQQLYDLTNQIATATTTGINLTPAPIASTLHVYLDGILQKQGADNVGDYIYDEVNRKITFHGTIDQNSIILAAYTSAT